MKFGAHRPWPLWQTNLLCTLTSMTVTRESCPDLEPFPWLPLSQISMQPKSEDSCPFQPNSRPQRLISRVRFSRRVTEAMPWLCRLVPRLPRPLQVCSALSRTQYFSSMFLPRGPTAKRFERLWNKNEAKILNTKQTNQKKLLNKSLSRISLGHFLFVVFMSLSENSLIPPLRKLNERDKTFLIDKNRLL